MISEKTLLFLAENRFNNSREWFQTHREEYEKYVSGPLKALAAELGGVVSGIDPEIITVPSRNGTLSRVHRDTRRVRDGMLYRENMWLSFKRDRKARPACAEFFLVITQTEFFYGCGYYMTSSEVMNALRSLIIARDPLFTEAQKVLSDGRFAFTDERYKKSRFPDMPEELKMWLDLKNFCLMRRSNDFSVLFSEDFGKTVGEDFLRLAPVYRLLMKAEDISHSELSNNSRITELKPPSAITW